MSNAIQLANIQYSFSGFMGDTISVSCYDWILLIKEKGNQRLDFLVCMTFPPLLVIFCFVIKCCHFPVRTKSKGKNEHAIINNLQEIFEEPSDGITFGGKAGLFTKDL